MLSKGYRFKYIFIVICILIPLITPLLADEYHYTVSYMKIPVLNVSISSNIQGEVWKGRYQASIKPAFSYIYDIDNIYEIQAEPNTWLPKRYVKQINEGKHHEQQTFQYNRNNNSVTLPTGRSVDFPRGTHSLFSAMLWVQHHNWTPGESRSMNVEIDGRRWRITLNCVESTLLQGFGDPVKIHLVKVQFGEPVGGTKLDQRTDYLSANIAAKGRILRFWIDTKKDLIYQIFIPMGPFSVKARLNR